MSYKILRSFALIEYENGAANQSLIRSNITSTLLTSLPLRLIISCSKQQIGIDGIFSYYIVLLNEGIYPIADLYLSDPLPACLTYIPHSLKCSDTAFCEHDAALFSSGLYLGTLNAGCQKLISFSVRLTSLPNEDQLENEAACTYTYPQFSSPCQLLNYTAYTNSCCCFVIRPKLTLIISCSSSYYLPKQPITYNLQLYNAGNIAVYMPKLHLSFNSKEAVFLPGSLIINCQSSPLDPFWDDLKLTALSPGEYYHIDYSVIPTSHCRHTLRHHASITYHIEDSHASHKLTPLKAKAAPYDLLPYAAEFRKDTL